MPRMRKEDMKNMGERLPSETSPLLERFLRYKLVIQGRSKTTVFEYHLDLYLFFRFIIARRSGIPTDDEQFEKIDISCVDEEFSKRQKIYTRRILLAVCLVLNDIFHFGNKRLMWVLKGIEDVMWDYASRVPKDYRAESPEDDELSRLLQEELNSRKGLSINIR